MEEEELAVLAGLVNQTINKFTKIQAPNPPMQQDRDLKAFQVTVNALAAGVKTIVDRIVD